MRCSVAAQLVCDQPPGFASLSLKELAKEAIGRTPIAARLDENIDQVAVLVDGAPEILPLTLDLHEDFVQVPRVAEATLLPSETACVLIGRVCQAPPQVDSTFSVQAAGFGQ